MLMSLLERSEIPQHRRVFYVVAPSAMRSLRSDGDVRVLQYHVSARKAVYAYTATKYDSPGLD